MKKCEKLQTASRRWVVLVILTLCVGLVSSANHAGLRSIGSSRHIGTNVPRSCSPLQRPAWMEKADTRNLDRQLLLLTLQLRAGGASSQAWSLRGFSVQKAAQIEPKLRTFLSRIAIPVQSMITNSVGGGSKSPSGKKRLGRRDQADPVRTHRIKHLAGMSLLALILSEGLFYAGTHYDTMVEHTCPRIVAWWRKGRSAHGLFHKGTWKTRNPNELQTAWDRQFPPSLQWVLGCAVGCVCGPVTLCATLCGLVATGVLYTLTEVAVRLVAVMPSLSSDRQPIWRLLENGLYTVRANTHTFFRERHWWMQAQNMNLLPTILRKGVLAGIILGLLLPSTVLQ